MFAGENVSAILQMEFFIRFGCTPDQTKTFENK